MSFIILEVEVCSFALVEEEVLPNLAQEVEE
jgi:hypothetical protein